MTAVTGKFVLKCRITNITTLFDISLFYVYKFYLTPQFHNIIPCEVLLYIEVTFLGFIHWYGDFMLRKDPRNTEAPHINI